MSARNEKANVNDRDVDGAMGVNLLEHRRNEEILEEAMVEPIAMVMRVRRLEWFGLGKIRERKQEILEQLPKSRWKGNHV